MDNFIKIIGCVLIASILYLILSKRDKDISVLLTLAVCSTVVCTAGIYLKPLLNFFEGLCTTANLNPEIFKILFQAVGIGILSEITALICTDIGNAAMGKTVQILSTVMILYLSLPLFQRLMDLINGILGSI